MADADDLWWAGVGFVGLAIFAYGLGSGPPARDALIAIEQEAPLEVNRVLIEGWGRNPDNYFTQRIRIDLPGHGRVTVSPAGRFLIGEIEELRRGTVRLLVEPRHRQVYEASVDGRVLIAYEAVSGRLRVGGRWIMLIGALVMAFAAWTFTDSARRPRWPGRKSAD